MPQVKFFWAVLICIIWLIATYFSVFFLIYDYKDVLWLEDIDYHAGAFYRYDILFPEKSFYKMVWAFRSVSVLFTIIISYGTLGHHWIIQEFRLVQVEFKKLLLIIFNLVRELSTKEKTTALIIIALIIVARLFYLNTLTLTIDEIASFDYFIMEGPLAVISFYPIPNNHILSNLISLVFYQFLSDPLLIMRVPTFIISLVGTLIIYLILIRYLGFAVATLSICTFSFSHMSLFYSIAGRGYFLLSVLSFVNLFSIIAVLKNPERQKMYFFLFITSGILGFYSVPTFLYPLASASLFSFGYFIVKRQWYNIKMLTFSVLIIFFGSVLLYLPVIFVSGIDSLINNKYLQPISTATFWSGYLYTFYVNECILSGVDRWGKYLIGLCLLIFTFKAIFLKKKSDYLVLGIMLAVMILTPYLFIIVQKIFPPGRTLFYKSIYSFVLISLILHEALTRVKFLRKLTYFLLVLVVIVNTSFLFNKIFEIPSEEPQLIQGFQWLRKNKPRHILVKDEYYSLYFNHRFKVAKINCRIYTEEKEGVKYDSIIRNRKFIQTEKEKILLDVGTYTKEYHNDYIIIQSK